MKNTKKNTKKVETKVEAKKASTKPTNEDVKKAQEANKVHIGKLCNFVPMVGEKSIQGGIRGLMTDRRVNLVYFRIQTEDEQIFHKRVDSDEIEILDELAPKTKKELERKEARQKAKLAKLEAKIAKAKTNLEEWTKNLEELKKN
jgi:hypothetical protein